MNCPGCGSSEVRASRRTRWSDFLHRARGQDAYRCRNCRLRFFASGSAGQSAENVIPASERHRSKPLPSSRMRRRFKRRLVVIAIFAVAFLLFLLFLRYLITERTPPQDSSVAISPLVSCSS